VDNADKKNTEPIPGERLVLLTWKQKNDSNWFGARIPGKLQSVEMVNIEIDSTTRLTTGYKIYVEGKLWSKPGDVYRKERIAFILGQLPSVIP
jgi:hypothetical protein